MVQLADIPLSHSVTVGLRYTTDKVTNTIASETTRFCKIV